MTTPRFEVAINSAKISCSLKIKGEEESPLAKHVLEIFLDHSSFIVHYFSVPRICVMQKWRDTMPQYCTRKQKQGMFKR